MGSADPPDSAGVGDGGGGGGTTRTPTIQEVQAALAALDRRTKDITEGMTAHIQYAQYHAQQADDRHTTVADELITTTARVKTLEEQVQELEGLIEDLKTEGLEQRVQGCRRILQQKSNRPRHN